MACIIWKACASSRWTSTACGWRSAAEGGGEQTPHTPPISVPGQAAPYDAASGASPRCKVLTSAGCCQVLESSFLVSLQTRSRLPPCHSARLSPQHVGVQNPGLMPIGLPVWVSLKGESHTAHGAFMTKAKVFVMSGARFGPVHSVPLGVPPSAGTASSLSHTSLIRPRNSVSGGGTGTPGG